MKSFKEYIEEAKYQYDGKILGPEFNYFYKDTFVIDTFHKLDRVKDRGAIEKSKDLFRKAIDHLSKFGKKDKQYLFVSNSTNLGMVVDYRMDRKKVVDDRLSVVIITWLGDVTKPPIRKTPEQVFAKKGTLKVLVESMDLGLDFDDIIFVELD